MKKLLVLFFAVFMLLGLCSCKNTQPIETKDVNVSSTQGADSNDSKPHVHEFGDWMIHTEASCTNIGKKIRTCACGEMEKETINKLGHDYQKADVIEPTTDTRQDIYISYACTRCQDSYSELMQLSGNNGLACQFAYSDEWGVFCEIVGIGKYVEKNYQNSVIGKAYVTLTIPSTVSGYPVKSIANKAFYDLSSLWKVNIPEGVLYIGESSFENCSGITDIKIPDSIIHIGDRAFYRCRFLSEISIPGSIEYIGNEIYGCCYSSLISVLGCDCTGTIHFDGTKAQWKSLVGKDWTIWGPGFVKVSCTDGTLRYSRDEYVRG